MLRTHETNDWENVSQPFLVATVWKDSELTTNVVIRPDGRISPPLTNEIEASGKTVIQAREEITGRFEYIAEPGSVAKQISRNKVLDG